VDDIPYLNTEVFWVVMLSNDCSAFIIRVKLSKILFFLCIISCVFDIYKYFVLKTQDFSVFATLIIRSFVMQLIMWNDLFAFTCCQSYISNIICLLLLM